MPPPDRRSTRTCGRHALGSFRPGTDRGGGDHDVRHHGRRPAARGPRPERGSCSGSVGPSRQRPPRALGASMGRLACLSGTERGSRGLSVRSASGVRSSVMVCCAHPNLPGPGGRGWQRDSAWCSRIGGCRPCLNLDRAPHDRYVGRRSVAADPDRWIDHAVHIRCLEALQRCPVEASTDASITRCTRPGPTRSACTRPGPTPPRLRTAR